MRFFGFFVLITCGMQFRRFLGHYFVFLPKLSLREKIGKFEERTVIFKIYWHNGTPYVNLSRREARDHWGKLDTLELRKGFITIREILRFCKSNQMSLDTEIFWVLAIDPQKKPVYPENETDLKEEIIAS